MSKELSEQIKQNLDNPKEVEKLYRENTSIFKRDFNLIYPDIQQNPAAQFWYERLNFEHESISWGTKGDLWFVILASLVAGLIAKIPEFFTVNADFFYARNIGFIVFPILITYFSWKQKISLKKGLGVAAALLVAVSFINLFPDDLSSDTLILSCIHLPLFLWALTGFVFIGNEARSSKKRLDFLRYNGDLVVMTTIIVIAGILLTFITLWLFEQIGTDISDFYIDYIVVFVLSASPIVGTYLVQHNPQLVNKVSPVIAKVFTPLVLIMLAFYLVAVLSAGSDPYNDREFLLLFNLLLIGVMAIILFSIAERSKQNEGKLGLVLLTALSLLTIVVNGIALSAIIFRISEWGITPNRLAGLGGNILILLNLMLVSFNLFKTLQNKKEIEHVENSIAKFLPIYSLWTIIVAFVFPLLFSFQ